MKKLIFALLALASPAMAEKAVVQKVDVNGTTYHVRYKPVEGSAMVYWKKISKLANASRFMEATEAAEKATGCKAGRTFTRDVALYVALECPEKAV